MGVHQYEADTLEHGTREGREDVVKYRLDIFCRLVNPEINKSDVKLAKVQELREGPVVIQSCKMQCDNGSGREAESAHQLLEHPCAGALASRKCAPGAYSQALSSSSLGGVEMDPAFG